MTAEHAKFYWLTFEAKMAKRCCCGKIEFDDDDLTPIAFNDMMHEVLGPKGNFCGSAQNHYIRNLEDTKKQLSECLRELIKWDGCDGSKWNAIKFHNARCRALELLER